MWIRLNVFLIRLSMILIRLSMNKSIRGVYRATQYLFLVLVTLLTIACSSKVQPEKAEKLTVEIATAADINPNDKGVANPAKDCTLYTQEHR
ncbi:Type VI secretion lipoprotein/VasD [Yersinia pestis Pestoides A]|nr:Type VI secretion lipoprotein/VasD [Yersinia pestis Pestoides A]